MDELQTGRLLIRSLTNREMRQQVNFTKNMLFAAIAASLSIVGLSAFFVSLWF